MSVRGLELELVAEDLESRRLFAVYEEARIVPARYRNDLRHVAVAAVALVDAPVSWNFKHLVNLKTRRTGVGARHVRQRRYYGNRRRRNLETNPPKERAAFGYAEGALAPLEPFDPALGSQRALSRCGSRTARQPHSGSAAGCTL
jgi:hypothetical protein